MSYLSRLFRSVFIISAFLCSLHIAYAYDITKVKVDALNDFVLEPSKVEIYANPGDKITRTITVTNRVPGKMKLRLEVEDFVGTRDPNTAVKLLGKDKSPYSFKDNLKPDVKEFSLNFGEKISIPVSISIPWTAQPGGFYASVIVSDAPTKEAIPGNVTSISRIGALFFIRVNGKVKEEGKLTDFRMGGPSKWIYQKGPFSFEILFDNSGTVHLVPYGKIAIKNFFGSEIAEVPVDAYFALPDSLRYREVPWYTDYLFGRYTATVELHRGYGDTVDTQSVAFWVIPTKIVFTVFAIIFVLVGLGYFVSSRFEFKRKQ
jgi:hypothetical protein